MSEYKRIIFWDARSKNWELTGMIFDDNKLNEYKEKYKRAEFLVEGKKYWDNTKPIIEAVQKS